MLNIEAIKEAEAAHEPFSFFQAQVLSEDDLIQIRADFPSIEKPGVFPVDALQYGPGFASLLTTSSRPRSPKPSAKSSAWISRACR